jgi:mannose/fructose/N-acetylgalactosamine-specific phosphotransferase system component IIB
MGSILVRVDNRLVHGQIFEAWVPFFRATSIVVVNDEVAGDLFRESVIKMAIPSDIEVIVQGVEAFAKEFVKEKWADKRVIVLFRDIHDAVSAWRMGVAFETLNIGNVHNEEGRCCITSSIFLSPGEIDELTGLHDAGVQIVMQCIPRDKPVTYEAVPRPV